jgi:hypothetical protein
LSGTTPLFSKICALNLNLEEDLAKKIMAMIKYYGGNVCDNLDETCTHAFSCDYDLNTKNFSLSNENDKVKIVTPDWILDCIEANQVIDEIKYNPKYLETNEENKEILEKLAKEKTIKASATETNELINSMFESEIDPGKTLNSPTPKPHKISLNTTHISKHNQINTNISTNTNVNNNSNIESIEKQIPSRLSLEANTDKNENLNESITQTANLDSTLTTSFNNEGSCHNIYSFITYTNSRIKKCLHCI